MLTISFICIGIGGFLMGLGLGIEIGKRVVQKK